MQSTDSYEERQMEFEALQAIYETDLSIETHGGNTQIAVNLSDSNTLVEFFLSDKYPDETPNIKVLKDSTEWPDKLEVYLDQKAKENVGTSMIFLLVEEAKDWISKHQDLSTTLAEGCKSSSQTEKVCSYFLEGKCKFGDKCFNKHAMQPFQLSNQDTDSLHANILSNSSAASSQNNRSSASTSTDATCSKVNEVVNSSLETDTQIHSEQISKVVMGKKKPMKTAADVISRIQWDEHLSEKDFVVGYLDRFIGIVEKNFSEFSWEDIASVDYNTLAIPQHRIQYFKYKGEIVWDKRERLDRVFGSTGNGETILQVVERHKQLSTVEEKVHSCSISKEEDGDKHVEDDIDDDNDAAAADGSTQLITHAGKHEKQEKEGPNYFIALPINNSKVIANIQELQERVVTAEPCFDAGAVPVQRLHVTLLTLTLPSEDQERTAKHVLKGLQPVVACCVPPTHTLLVRGVGTFRNRILYVGVQQDPLLNNLVNILKYKFSQAGLTLDGNRNVFCPHITIFRGHRNLSANRAHQIFTEVESKFIDYTLGDQQVETLELCSKFSPKEPNGSFHSILTVRNSILTLSSSLVGKLLMRLESLDQEGKLKSETKDHIVRQFNSGDAVDAEEALKALEMLVPKENRVVFIFRGLPGCGKTYLIENCTEYEQRTGIAVLNNTQLFQKANNISVEQTELSISETYCRIRFLESLASDVPLVVVDGVHSQRWEYTLYQRLARAFGYQCRVIEIRCVDSAAIKLCQKYCRSEFSLEQLTLIVESWENDPEAMIIAPWFSKTKHRQGQSVTLKQFT